MTGMQPESVNDTGMRFRIINDHIMSCTQHINDADHTLISVIQQCGVLFIDEFCKLFFKLFMLVTVPAHHSGAHRGRQSEIGSTFCIGFANLGMIGQSKIIIEAPYDHFLPPKLHAAADLSFQFWKCEIAMRSFTMLPDWAGMLDQSFKNI